MHIEARRRERRLVWPPPLRPPGDLPLPDAWRRGGSMINDLSGPTVGSQARAAVGLEQPAGDRGGSGRSRHP